MYTLLLASLFIFSTLAQYPPPQANLTTITSPVDGNITISYKTPPAGTCTTAFSTQQQYTGWVNIPGTFPTHTFFWFIAGRDNSTQQLTVWLNGGPGSSSLFGMFTENGPCEAVEVAQGQFGTRARDFGWDRASNMLYIDQPTQVGLSYDIATNCSLDLLTSNLYTPPQQLPNSQPVTTFLNGTFGSLNTNNTQNTTEIAAMAIWHVMQAFLGTFPQYNPVNSTSSTVGVNLMTESYGGKYGPAFATYWDLQNAKRLNGTISRTGTLAVKLVSLGIWNGCVDDLIQGPYYPVMANNNSFGYTAINPTRASLANASFYSSGGCRDSIIACRAAVAAQDPDNNGNVDSVNSLCAAAQQTCETNVIEPYSDSRRSYYDIAHSLPDSFPPSTYIEYLNLPSVQAAIGTPINYTETDLKVVSAFEATGDYERYDLVPQIAKLLNKGIRVGFIYGDRDYICNWYGGEAISLSVAANASVSYQSKFPAAGYAPIIVNSSYIGGVVRQFGNLSFSRIYDAGHMVPAYQPETAFNVFARLITGNAISTGEIIDLSSYNSTGPAIASHTTSLPSSPTNTCWLRNIVNTCSDDQKNAIENQQGVIINGVWYSASSDWTTLGLPTSLSSSGTALPANTASVTTVTQVLTGAYTATATPSMKGAAPGFRDDTLSWFLLSAAVGVASLVVVLAI